MQNIDMHVDGNTLTLKIDLSKRLGHSSSGKNVIIATTGGNKGVPGHDGIKVGVNIYTGA